MRYGILFQESLLSSSHVTRVSPDTTSAVPDEDASDRAFNVRDPTRGLNLDYMTYAMYSLAHQDPLALLNTTAMDALARRTFSTFFQHYASGDGGWAFQPLNATLPNDLGAYYAGSPAVPPPRSGGPTSNGTAVVRISRRTDVLDVNAAAVWLSVGILAWLAATVAVVAGLQRRYLRGLDRDVGCVADVLVLVAGSERLLRLMREGRAREGGGGEDGGG
ncbi:hypothetical protein SLS54_003104 [Diplodia seriata]